MIYVTRRFEFAAAHRYWRADWSPEQNERAFGKYTSPYGHGHNYTLDVTVAGVPDPLTGMVISTAELNAIVGGVLEEFDHKHLNEDTPYFKQRIPTTENIVRVLWELIAPRMPQGVALARLRLYELNDLWAEYTGEDEASFTRSYVFSAAHRLHASALSAEQNRALYGRSNNPHGHNYVLEVTLSGAVDQATGMLIDLVEMDQTVRDVLDRFEHRDLDREVAALADRPSTGENIVACLWQELAPRFGGRLARLRLWETDQDAFEYQRPI